MASRSVDIKVRLRDLEPIKAALAALGGTRAESFPARFDGLCAGCGTSIFPGQQIVRMPDGGHRHDLVGCLP